MPISSSLSASFALFSSPLAIPGTTSYCRSISVLQRRSREQDPAPWIFKEVLGSFQVRYPIGFTRLPADRGTLEESEGRVSGEVLQLPPACRCTTAPPTAVTLTCVPVTGAFSDTINTGLSSFWLHMKEKCDLVPTSELLCVPNHDAFTSHL